MIAVLDVQVAGPTALAVSRAIGDILMKEPRKLVISDPEIKTIDLLPQVLPTSLNLTKADMHSRRFLFLLSVERGRI